MKAWAKKAATLLEERDYLYERTNSRGARVYKHTATGHEIAFFPGCDQSGYQRLTSDVNKALGIAKDRSQKHRPDQIRFRQERQRELARLRALAQQERSRLAADLKGLDIRQIEAREREIEDYDRRIREIERLMQPGAA